GQSRQFARDRHALARYSGCFADAHHVFLRALDQKPVAEILDERTVRILFGDVREEEDAAGAEESGDDQADEKRRSAIVEIVEESAGDREIELRFDGSGDGERVPVKEVQIDAAQFRLCEVERTGVGVI